MFHRFAGKALREMASLGEQTIEVDVALAILHECLRQDDIDRQCPECFGTNIRPGITRAGLRTCADCRRKFETEFLNVSMAEVQDLYWVVKKWAHDNAFAIENLVTVEQRLRAVVSYANPHGGSVERTLTGQLDALFVEGEYDNEAVVLDWKDMWALPGPTDVSSQGYFQQRFYAWLLMRQPELRAIEKVTLREFYVRYSEPREATIWRDSLDDIEAELAALAERFDRAYEENAWVPTPGRHCNYCIRPSACPIPVFARDEGRITNPERAKRVAASLLVAEKVVRDNRAALRAYSKVHGPIPIKYAKGQRAMGYQPVERVARPTQEELERAIREAGTLDALDVRRLYRKTIGTKFTSFEPDPMEETRADRKLLTELEASLEQARQRHAKEVA